VAESLERVDQPLETMLRGLAPGSPGDVIGQIALNLARPRDTRPPPDWLRLEQRPVCSQLLPVVKRYGCALLAGPVGSGKTYLALAVAARWPSHRPATVLAPAAILDQWKRVSSNLGIPVELWSHERVSRGKLPLRRSTTSRRSLVIIDESHHFRNPAILRYQHLAPWLIGSVVLLLSATPVVNGLEDLAAQLALGARDDALLPFGIPSLKEHLTAASGPASAAIGELVLTGGEISSGKPERVRRKENLAPDSSLEERCRRIERLSLSTSPATAGLIRTLIWRALASSDMALAGLFRRYRSLLLQARDAAGSGRTFARSAVRDIVGDAGEQMVMWSLFAPPDIAGDLVLSDLDLLDSLIAEATEGSRSTDRKCDRLETLLQDGKPTLVFTGSRDTVRYLRERIPMCSPGSVPIEREWTAPRYSSPPTSPPKAWTFRPPPG
jgi:hypothetical protein